MIYRYLTVCIVCSLASLAQDQREDNYAKLPEVPGLHCLHCHPPSTLLLLWFIGRSSRHFARTHGCNFCPFTPKSENLLGGNKYGIWNQAGLVKSVTRLLASQHLWSPELLRVSKVLSGHKGRQQSEQSHLLLRVPLCLVRTEELVE